MRAKTLGFRIRKYFRPCLEFLSDRVMPSTCTVTSLADTMVPGTLRSCMDDMSVDYIDFQQGLTGIIYLGSALPLVSRPLEIAGPGYDIITVQRNVTQPFRIFTITSAAVDVTISGLKIANGRVEVSEGGGGILNQATLRLYDVILFGNATATLLGGPGGGLRNLGTLEIYGSEFEGNSVQDSDGGGLSNVGTATIEFTKFSGNAAGYIGKVGGGSGGAIANGGPLTVRYGTFGSNISQSAGGNTGGAISNGSSQAVVIEWSEFYDNSAESNLIARGGAIYNGSVGDMRISYSVFGEHPDVPLGSNGNTARGYRDQQGIGGAICNEGRMRVEYSRFHRNRTAQANLPLDPIAPGGGAIYNSGRLTTLYNTFTHNETQTNGGAIYNDDTPPSFTVMVKNSSIVDNRAARGAGIYNGGDALHVKNSTIGRNRASSTRTAGGIHNASGDTTTTLTNVTLHDNEAPVGSETAANLFASVDVGTGFSTITYLNTIISVAPANPHPRNCLALGSGGVLTSRGHNISHNPNNILETSCNLTGVGDQQNVDPKLNPLDFNGGPPALAQFFYTHSLQMGSPAINAGDTTQASGDFDQRGDGYARVVNSNVDVGAFECQPGECGLEPSPLPQRIPHSDLSAIIEVIQAELRSADVSDQATAGYVSKSNRRPGLLVTR